MPQALSVVASSDPSRRVTLPPYLELGLNPGHSGRFDLVLAQASPGTRRGLILAVWSITPATTQQSHVLLFDTLNQPAWPTDFLPTPHQLSGRSTASHDPVLPNPGLAQSLILFEGDTGLSTLRGSRLLTIGHGSAVRRDVWTFGPSGSTASLYDETPLITASGESLARPVDALPIRVTDPLLNGPVDPRLSLQSLERTLRLNPGELNLPSQPIADHLPSLPEPTTLGALLALLGLSAGRRRLQ